MTHSHKRIARFKSNLLEWTQRELELVIESMKRNPTLSNDEIQEYVGTKSVKEISLLLTEIKAIIPLSNDSNQYLINNAENESLERAMQLCWDLSHDELNFSTSIADILESISRAYPQLSDQDQGKMGRVDYRAIYQYFSALLSHKPLPNLKGFSAGIVMELLFSLSEVVGGQIDLTNPESTINPFEEHEKLLEERLAHYILATESKELKNQLAEIFKLPVLTSDRKNYPIANKKISLHSLNPLNMPRNLVKSVDQHFNKYLDGVNSERRRKTQRALRIKKNARNFLRRKISVKRDPTISAVRDSVDIDLDSSSLATNDSVDIQEDHEMEDQTTRRALIEGVIKSKMIQLKEFPVRNKLVKVERGNTEDIIKRKMNTIVAEAKDHNTFTVVCHEKTRKSKTQARSIPGVKHSVNGSVDHYVYKQKPSYRHVFDI